MTKHLHILITTFETGEEAPLGYDSREMMLDITHLANPIEHITESVIKQLTRDLFNIPTPIQEGGRG